MMGRRVEFFPGWPKDQAQPGDYCKASPEAFPWCNGEVWEVAAPDGSLCTLGDTSVHTVTEHGDGTISVVPSIVTATWHGFLTRGVWT